ncbi:hypothetical protein Tsubulata_037042, partial [Turnera subulata]
MGDDRKSSRKPVSLNDRHYRFLEELSAPPPPKPSASTAFHVGNAAKFQAQPRFSIDDDEEEFQAEPHLAKVDNDEDKFLEQRHVSKEEKKAKLKIEGRRRLCKGSKNVASEQSTTAVSNEPSFDGILDSDSPFLEKPQDDDPAAEKDAKVKVQPTVVLPNEPSFAGILDSDSPLQEKPQGDDPAQKEDAKVKIEGRRRLCKVSKDAVSEQSTAVAPSEPSFDAILDFDSPIPAKPQDNSNPGVGEINDILDDLTSRLDFLSIDKKKAPRSCDFAADDLLTSSVGDDLGSK